MAFGPAEELHMAKKPNTPRKCTKRARYEVFIFKLVKNSAISAS